MSAHVFLNLLKRVEQKRSNARLVEHFISINEFNKFNNTGARLLDSF